MGVQTKLWGKPYWDVLFWSAANATDLRRKTIFRNLVLNYASTGGLPCADCNKHFDQMIRTPGYKLDDYYGGSNEDLVYLVYQWKSAVNRRLNKPNLSWDKVKQMYLSSDATCSDKCEAK